MNSLVEIAVGGAIITGAVTEIVISPMLHETGPNPQTEVTETHNLRRAAAAGFVGAAIVAHGVYSMVKGS